MIFWAFIAVPLAVLALASSARAQSAAWVLWEQQRTPRPEPPPIDARTPRQERSTVDTWIVVETFATKVACEARRREFRDPLSLPEQVTKGVTGPRHVCLPDGDDPRRPNESGR